jgi:hypothetical protein
MPARQALQASNRTEGIIMLDELLWEWIQIAMPGLLIMHEVSCTDLTAVELANI